MNTLAGIKVEIEDALVHETIKDRAFLPLAADAIEHLFMQIMRLQVSLFLSGPVNLTLAAASERQTLTSVADPVAGPVVANSGAASVLPALVGMSFTFTLATDSGSETLESPATAFNRPLNGQSKLTSPAFVAGAIGYNVYAGSVAGRRTLQNSEPIPFGQDWVEDIQKGVTDAPNSPLPPTDNTTADDLFYIRHLEVPTSNGGYKAWDQADIDSALMRSYSRLTASTSEYQSYAFDIINGRTVEVRPALGSALTPRYFYIKKPRRPRFLTAPFPFPTMPAQAWFKYHIAEIYSAGIGELKQAAYFEKKATEELSALLQSVIQQSHAKDLTIQPHMRW